MPAVPHASDVTVGEVLTLLDGTFSGMAEAVAEDRYAFWLGSGISLGRIAGLKQLIRRALDHLQSKVEAGDAACRYRKAIGEVLRVAGLSTVERDAIDPERPTAEWPNLLGIIERLAGNYARFLEIAVDGEPDDYILWAGVDFCGVYADPDMEPDAEHLCMAVLILEGLASKIASANWDDLIEKAVAELSPGVPALVVCVTSRDLREPHLQGHLYKFHGCAVRARDDIILLFV